MNIPYPFSTKFSPYEFQFHGKKITTYVAYDSSGAEEYANVIENLIGRKKKRLVGVDVKKDEENAPKLLILCISSHCLVIQLAYTGNNLYWFSNKLFMEDSSICFVGNKSSIGTRFGISEGSIVKGVELGFLAARMKKNPDLLQEFGGSSLKKLADVAGVEMPDMKKDIKPPNWGASVFSEDQMKIVIHDAYMRFLIAAKLLGVDGDC